MIVLEDSGLTIIRNYSNDMVMGLIADKKISAMEIVTPQQQKAYLHPLRMKILSFLVKENLTVSQVAERLGVHPANISHHFKILSETQLICLIEERDTGRVIEKYYGAAAQVYNIRPPEGSVKNVNGKVLSFLRDDLAGSIGLLAPDDSEALVGLIEIAKISKDQFKDFSIRLRDLITEFEKSGQPEGERYALNVSLYPHKIDYGPIGRIEYKKNKVKVVK